MTRDDLIERLNLTDDHYTVIQSLIRNKYRAEDANGNTVLRGKQKFGKLKEEFPFQTPDGEDAFTVKAGGILDISGDYVLIDEATGEEVLILEKNFSLVVHKWKIRDPETEALLGKIESKSAIVCLLRTFSDIASLIPHKYEIEDADSGHVGTINGHFSIKDKYDVNIDDASNVPKEAVVVAAMIIDALEGN